MYICILMGLKKIFYYLEFYVEINGSTKLWCEIIAIISIFIFISGIISFDILSKAMFRRVFCLSMTYNTSKALFHLISPLRLCLWVFLSHHLKIFIIFFIIFFYGHTCHFLFIFSHFHVIFLFARKLLNIP